MHPKQTLTNSIIRNLRTPPSDRLPPTTFPLWLFCWPETGIHEIVAASTPKEAMQKAKGNPWKALRNPYYGGPCAICGTFDIQLPTILDQLKGDKHHGKVIPTTVSRNKN